MGQDNNSLSENAHNTTNGTLSQWISKEKKYTHVSTEIHTTWDKTTTHLLRMNILIR